MGTHIISRTVSKEQAKEFIKIIREADLSQSPRKSALEWAPIYCGLGWECLPLRERSKRPFLPGGYKAATRDLRRLREHFKNQKYNIGARTGTKSNLLVIDIDPRHGGDVEDVILTYNLPPTCVSHTGGGGFHLCYKCSARLRTHKLGEGVEVMAEGSLIVLPNSVHPKTEELYNWNPILNPLKPVLAELPSHLVDVFKKGERKKPFPLGKAGVIPKGHRNTELTRIAGYFRSIGWLPEQIYEVLLCIDEKFCKPPLQEENPEELEKIAWGMGRYPPGNMKPGQIDRIVAEEFVNMYGNMVRYCKDWEKWFIRRNSIWVPARYNEILHLGHSMLDDKGGEYLWDGAGRKRLRCALVLVKKKVPIRPKDFDRDPDLLNTPNGVVHLPTSRYCNKEGPFTMKTGRYTSQGERTKLSPLLEKLAGYAATGHTKDGQVFVLIGRGKKSFANSVCRALGTYALEMDLHYFLSRRRSEEKIREVRSKRLIVSQGNEKLVEKVAKLLKGSKTKVFLLCRKAIPGYPFAEVNGGPIFLGRIIGGGKKVV